MARSATCASRRGSGWPRAFPTPSSSATATSSASRPDGPEKIGEERVGRLVLDGDVILPADGSTINERRKIAINGLITVALPIDGDGQLAGKPLVRPFGVPVEEDRDDFLADAADAAATRL